MKKILVVTFLAFCSLNVLAQTQIVLPEEAFSRLAQALKQAATGTVRHSSGSLVRDSVEYVRLDGCRFAYRRTAEIISPTPSSPHRQSGSPVSNRAEFEIEEWRLKLSDIDPKSIAVVKPWTASVGQRLFIEFSTASGKKLIDSRDDREPWRRQRGKVSKGRLTVHDDAAAAGQVASDLKRAVELCQE